MRRFAALSAKRRRRQKRAIGFDHKFPERNFCRDLSHGHAVFESNNSSERNEMVKGENFIRLFKRATEAVKNTAHLAGISTQDFKRIFPRVALMNHHVEPELDGQIELLLEQTRLFRFVMRRREFALRFLHRFHFAEQSSPAPGLP